jgi:hypothetical protein
MMRGVHPFGETLVDSTPDNRHPKHVLFREFFMVLSLIAFDANPNFQLVKMK